MSNTIDPKVPAGPAGVPGESPTKNPDPADQNLINELTLKLALLKKTPGMSPQVIETLENQLKALKSGFSTWAEAKAAFDEAVSNAVEQGQTDTSYTFLNFAASELVKLSNNETLEKLKKDGEDQNNN